VGAIAQAVGWIVGNDNEAAKFTELPLETAIFPRYQRQINTFVPAHLFIYRNTQIGGTVPKEIFCTLRKYGKA
jgi:hypothetical protein